MKSLSNNQQKTAVALSYDSNSDTAPKVIAKGKGAVAENIIEKAKHNNIPIQEDPSLADLLSQLEINKTIPEELYQAVAEIFAFIYKIDQSIKTENK